MELHINTESRNDYARIVLNQMNTCKGTSRKFKCGWCDQKPLRQELGRVDVDQQDPVHPSCPFSLFLTYPDFQIPFG